MNWGQAALKARDHPEWKKLVAALCALGTHKGSTIEQRGSKNILLLVSAPRAIKRLRSQSDCEFAIYC